ncbi:hypothetical protein ACHAWX_001992 [Stephanocyclus meneghinianus]
MSSSLVTPQSKTLALLPKFTGFFSLVGSTFIFQDILCHGTPSPTKRVFHRVMLGLSISDGIASVVNILSTWPIPKGTPGVYLASGTTATCTAQGFFNELGNLAAPLYNVSLCVYFVRKICDGLTEDDIRSKDEKFMLSAPAVIAATIAVLGLVFDLYNNSGWLCWFAENPPGCAKSVNTDCIRGEHAETFRWIHQAFVWTAICFIGYQMYSIYRYVKVQERNQYVEATDEDGRQRGTNAKKVAIQAALFVGALYLTWFFTTVARIYQNITGHNNFVLQLLMAVFFPLQGFFNAFIYIRPRYLRAKSRNPQFSARKLFRIALHHDGHPVHGSSTRGYAVQRDPRPRWERRRQSPTASDFSIAIPQMGQSTDGDSAVAEDGPTSVADTVNARADESEFQNRHVIVDTDTGVKSQTDVKDTSSEKDERTPDQVSSWKLGDRFEDNPLQKQEKHTEGDSSISNELS